ncbi:MAG: nucleotidyltransferase domain-containing protein [Actinomycetota bacterium]|nr:nucleotidyltransferase domain-containing protein [Actinomycetota bacterium]
MGAEHILARRRAERDAMVERARRFAQSLDAGLDVRAAVVVGSVARGDFNRWSDVDVVVVAAGFRETLLERLERLGPRPGRVEPVPWTPEEWDARLRRGDPMVAEALEGGIWMMGSPAALEGQPG